MRIEYDAQADAAYIYFTDSNLTPGRDMVPLTTPPGVQAMVNMDWKDGKIVGVEVLGATALLHSDFLAQATSPGGG